VLFRSCFPCYYFAAVCATPDLALLWGLFASLSHLQSHVGRVLASQHQQHALWAHPPPLPPPQQQGALLQPWLLLAALAVDAALLLQWGRRMQAAAAAAAGSAGVTAPWGGMGAQGQWVAHLLLANAATQLACVAAKLLLLWALRGAPQAVQQPVACSQAAHKLLAAIDAAGRLCCAALPMPLW
jgi:hypothetical protein